MKFVSKEIIDAPLDTVWHTLAKAPALQDWAQSRNLTLTRNDNGTALDIGTSWSAQVAFVIVKGTIKAEITKLVPSKRIVLQVSIRGIDATIRLALKADTSRKTQLRVATTLKSSSIMGPVALLALSTQEALIANRHETLTKNLADYISENWPHYPVTGA